MQRLIATVPLVVIASIIIFGLVHLMPGDPAETIAGDSASEEQIEAIRVQLGLDRPVIIQYADWASRAATGDLGTSLFGGVRVADAIMARLPVTLSLTLAATAVALIIGVSAGVTAALRPGSLVDRLLTAAASLGLSVPNFWFGLILVVVFALGLGWFPATGYVPFGQDPVGWARSLALPAIALGTSGASGLARQTRGAMVDVLQRPFIQSAEAKGLPTRVVVGKHGLKNAAIPVVTVLGLQLSSLLSGAIIVEQVFALPGLGQLAITAVNRRDIPTIQGIVLATTLIVAFTNLLVDICYSWLNPKVRSS